ncbi:hypothetical protein LMG29542_07329 [Paraburkholderia humisilvae]|uniref:Uncharacterized protein n=1 Tax=Paraburkholderia humisilvae TaxID=627669 RepID=A0A6J5F8J4_9BURK|nr:hypothetical protein LMG29542_07329 [Paraburkholderia humisilvae]
MWPFQRAKRRSGCAPLDITWSSRYARRLTDRTTLTGFSITALRREYSVQRSALVLGKTCWTCMRTRSSNVLLILRAPAGVHLAIAHAAFDRLLRQGIVNRKTRFVVGQHSHGSLRVAIDAAMRQRGWVGIHAHHARRCSNRGPGCRRMVDRNCVGASLVGGRPRPPVERPDRAGVFGDSVFRETACGAVQMRQAQTPETHSRRARLAGVGQRTRSVRWI